MDKAVEVFKELWPEIRQAMDRENAAWEAYTKVGITRINRELVSERMEATKRLRELLLEMAYRARYWV